MTWSAHPTISTGSTVTAADWNLYVKGNLDTLFPYTAGMQVAYSTSSTSLSKATAGAALYVLRSNSTNSAIEFAKYEPVYKRQGQTSTTWFIPTYASTVNIDYTPTNVIMQAGSLNIIYGNSATFPVVFSKTPFVMSNEIIIDTAGRKYTVTPVPYTDKVDFSLTLVSTGHTISAPALCWLAIGEA